MISREEKTLFEHNRNRPQNEARWIVRSSDRFKLKTIDKVYNSTWNNRTNTKISVVYDSSDSTDAIPIRAPHGRQGSTLLTRHVPMYVIEKQLRFLSVCKVKAEVTSDVFDLPLFSPEPTFGSVLAKPPFLNGMPSMRGTSTFQKDHLLVLTCDHIALLGAGEGEETVAQGAEGSIMSMPKMSLTEGDAPLVLYVPLSQVISIDVKGNAIEVRYVPNWMPIAKKNETEGSVPIGPVLLAHRAMKFLHWSNSRTKNGHDARGEDGEGIERGKSRLESLGTLKLRTQSEEGAQKLASAMKSAVARLIDALVWLDKRVTLNRELHVCVVSLEFDHQSSPRRSHQHREDSCVQYVISRSPAWGSCIRVDPTQFRWVSNALLPSYTIHFDLSSPIGHAYGAIDTIDLDGAVQKFGGALRFKALPLHVPDQQASTVEPWETTDGDGVRGQCDVSRHAVEVYCSVKPLPSENKSKKTAKARGQSVWSAPNVLVPLCVVLIAVVLQMLGLMTMPSSAAQLALLIAILSMSAQFLMGSSPMLEIFLPMRCGEERGNQGFVVELLGADLIEEPLRESPSPASKGGSSKILARNSPRLSNRNGLSPNVASRPEDASLSRAMSRMTDLHPALMEDRVVEPSGPAHPVSEQRSQSQAPSVMKSAKRMDVIDIGAPTFRRVLSTSFPENPNGGGKPLPGPEIVSVLDEEVMSDDAEGLLLSTRDARLLTLLQERSSVAESLFPYYVAACGGNTDRALQRLQATIEWRCEHEVDSVLESPIPRFFEIKDAYQHGIIGRDFKGRPIVYEAIGGFRSSMLEMRKKGITPADLMHQFIFVMEFLCKEISRGQPPPHGQFVRIYDFKGMRLLDISDSESVAVGQLLMQCLESHYPERMATAFVVNAPAFFPTVWKVVRPMVDPRTAHKITVASSKKAALENLRSIMSDEVIPMEFGGLNSTPFDNQDQRRLCQLVRDVSNVST